MKRTQIYLSYDLHSKVLSFARKNRKSLAQVIREATEKFFVSVGSETGNDLHELSGLKLSGGPSDLSKQLDEYLYKSG